MKRFILTCLVGGVLIYSWGLNATVTTVINPADHGHGSLRQAIGHAQNGDQIVLEVSDPIMLESTLNINKSITISGNIKNRTKITFSDNTKGEHLVVNIDVSAGRVVLNNLIISQGLGGIKNSANLTIQNSEIRDNKEYKGSYPNFGGICNLGQLTVKKSLITGNTGSGISNCQGSMSIQDTTINKNHTNFFGGGIFNASLPNFDEIEISNCDISENVANGGGGIFNITGKIKIIKYTRIHDNVAKEREHSSVKDGGGIYNCGHVTVDETCSIENNVADGQGGGVFVMKEAKFSPEEFCCSIGGNKPNNIYIEKTDSRDI